jgi:hypothetical protein
VRAYLEGQSNPETHAIKQHILPEACNDFPEQCAVLAAVPVRILQWMEKSILRCVQMSLPRLDIQDRGHTTCNKECSDDSHWPGYG